MADNYLEKKMEEHRRGSNPAPRRPLTPAGTTPGSVIYNIGKIIVAIAGTAQVPEVAEATIAALTAHGATVLFDGTDIKTGRAIAQRHAARHIPAEGLDDMTTVYPATADADYKLVFSKNEAVFTAPDAKKYTLAYPTPEATLAETLPAVILYLLHPLSGTLAANNIVL